MPSQIGARFLARKNKEVVEPEKVCVNHYKPEESVLVKPGVRKRFKFMRRQAE